MASGLLLLINLSTQVQGCKSMLLMCLGYFKEGQGPQGEGQRRKLFQAAAFPQGSNLGNCLHSNWCFWHCSYLNDSKIQWSCILCTSEGKQSPRKHRLNQGHTGQGWQIQTTRNLSVVKPACLHPATFIKCLSITEGLIEISEGLLSFLFLHRACNTAFYPSHQYQSYSTKLCSSHLPLSWHWYLHPMDLQ